MFISFYLICYKALCVLHFITITSLWALRLSGYRLKVGKGLPNYMYFLVWENTDLFVIVNQLAKFWFMDVICVIPHNVPKILKCSTIYGNRYI